MPLGSLTSGSARRDARPSPCFGSPLCCSGLGGDESPWLLPPGNASAGSCSSRCVDAALASALPALPAIATAPAAGRKRKATPGYPAADLLASGGTAGEGGLPGGGTAGEGGLPGGGAAAKRPCLGGAGAGDGLLLCEEGLEAEEAGAAGPTGPAGCSPVWELGADDDARSLPGSESGSQHSAGARARPRRAVRTRCQPLGMCWALCSAPA